MGELPWATSSSFREQPDDGPPGVGDGERADVGAHHDLHGVGERRAGGDRRRRRGHDLRYRAPDVHACRHDLLEEAPLGDDARQPDAVANEERRHSP
jgi:hypothetical protein